jgi:hypothetical protein
MRPLSATEAISPAIERTKSLLRPFSWTLWLKLGFVSFLAEMTGQFLVPPLGHVPRSHSFATGIGAVAGGISIAIFAVIGIVFFVVGLALLYFGSRMQIVLMDLVATHTTLIGPAWQRTAPRTWRWIGLKVVGFLAAFLVLGAIAIVPILSFMRAMRSVPSHPPAGALFGTFALFFVIFILLVLVFMIVTWWLRDFVLPFVLFEDAPFVTALSNAFAIFRYEPGSVLFYLFLKFVLSLVAGIAAELCIVVSLAILAIPFGLLGAGLWFGLHQAGTVALVAMYTGFALLGVVFLACCIVLVLCIAGATLIFYQAYALYFVGGRIPPLGDLLDRSTPPPVYAMAFPPHFPPPVPPAI